MNEPNKREEEQFIEEAMDDLDVQFWEISSEKDQRKVWSNIKEKIAAAIEYGKELQRKETKESQPESDSEFECHCCCCSN